MSRVGAVGSVVVNETSRLVGWVKRGRRVRLDGDPPVKATWAAAYRSPRNG